MTERALNGAHALVRAAVASGVTTCFANPGTTEMPIVEALDGEPGLRAVLALQENVCTGAADGYARVTGRPALTVLHLGPGLANGLANLHNARRANTPVVNVVGDHASWHLQHDAPLTSDIAALAGTVGTVATTRSREDVPGATVRAIHEARQRVAVSTLVVPADHQQETGLDVPLPPPVDPARPRVNERRLAKLRDVVLEAGRDTVLLLGGTALTERGQRAAARLTARLGAHVYCETFPAVAARGGGLAPVDRLPYFPEKAVAALAGARAVITAGAEEPVAYFGYEGMPSLLAPAGSVHRLACVHEDAEQALEAFADLLGCAPAPSAIAPVAPVETPSDDAPLTPDAIARALAHDLPDGAIVSIEGGTVGYPFFSASAGSAPHTVMTNTGGAIGQGLPCALGAALGAPDRVVVAVQSDGSGLYTPQALWTMAREKARVVVLVMANHSYGVLRTELARHGNAAYGPQARSLTSLADPQVDWLALAGGFGVPAQRVGTVGALRGSFKEAVAADGPVLLEVTL